MCKKCLTVYIANGNANYLSVFLTLVHNFCQHFKCHKKNCLETLSVLYLKYMSLSANCSVLPSICEFFVNKNVLY